MKVSCSLCGGSTEVTACGDGHLCQPCAEKNRVGRDSTTRKAKLMQKALRGKAEAARNAGACCELSGLNTYEVESAVLLAMDERIHRPLTGAGGEILPQDDPGLRDTMAAPGTVHL